MSLSVRSGTILTLNDQFDIVEGDLSIRDGRVDRDRPHLAAVPDPYSTLVYAAEGSRRSGKERGTSVV
jgi:hypothetical protein